MDLSQITLKHLPAFIYESSFAIGFPQKISFFDERYISLIDLVMEGSRSFCVSSVVENLPFYAQLVQIKQIQTLNYQDRKVYKTELECIYRLEIIKAYSMVSIN